MNYQHERNCFTSYWARWNLISKFYLELLLEEHKIRDGSNNSTFQPDQFISGNESTRGNFAKGYFRVGQNLIDAIIYRIRLQIERCYNLEDFVITNSVGGGSRSGLTSLIQEKLSQQFEKKIKFGLSIFPTSTFYPSYNTETYNSVFSAHSMLILRYYFPY